MVIEKVDLIVKNAAELLTLRGNNEKPRTGEGMQELGIVQNGAVAVSRGEIVGVGETKEILEKFESDNVIDASSKVVMPGFVDPHTHLIFAGSRENEFEMKLQGATYLEILEKGGGILSTVNKTREASKEELIQAAVKRLDRMLAYGTTTVEAKSGYGLTVEDEVKCLEVMRELKHDIELVPTFMGAHAIPPEFTGRTDDYVGLVVDEMLSKVAEAQLAEYCDIFCEKGIFSVEQSRKILEKAKELGLGLRVHADEIVQLGGTELAAELGAVSAEHLAKSSDTGVKAMAEKGVIAVLLPGTPFVLMEKEHQAARKMIEEGVPVALATDLNPNCYTESMQIVLTLACLQMRMMPAEVIVASTINAAHVVGRADRIGSLEVGKQADLIVLDAPDYQYVPYHFGVNLVETVIKKGKVVR